MDKLKKYLPDARSLHSLTVNVGGEQVFKYGDINERRDVYSATKSILSIAVGELSDSGRIDINAPLSEYLTSSQLLLLPDNRRKAFCTLPITRFLTMSIKGYPFRPEGDSGWLSQALRCDIDYTAAAQFSYSNFPALLTAAACENVTGGLSGYIQNILLLTADINSADYKLTPEGFFYGASGMKLTCCELERIGLYLLRRSYESSGYLSHALSKQIDTPTGGYGFYFWLEDGCICISGKWGQKCIISKEQGSVISYLSTGQQADNTLYTLALNAKLC